MFNSSISLSLETLKLLIQMPGPLGVVMDPAFSSYTATTVSLGMILILSELNSSAVFSVSTSLSLDKLKVSIQMRCLFEENRLSFFFCSHSTSTVFRSERFLFYLNCIVCGVSVSISPTSDNLALV